MKPWLKTLITIACILVIIFLIMNFFKKDPVIKQIMEKLDSTKILLDSAQARIDLSRGMISDLQENIDSYSLQVQESDANVAALVATSNMRENAFLRKLGSAEENYQDLKQQFTKRTFWPEIIIDTSHYTVLNAE